MLRTDFSNQPYIAEVLKTSNNTTADRAPKIIESLIDKTWSTETISEVDGNEIVVHHGLVPSRFAYHRSTRTITAETGKPIQVPRTRVIGKREHYFYDILLLRRNDHLVIAVPFHGLATRVFFDIDKALAGTRTVYEKLDITKMVIRLGSAGKIPLKARQDDSDGEIIVTRCHLAYNDPKERRRDLEQVRLNGSNLGASNIYFDLVDPVLNRGSSKFVVTPILLGFALVRGGVRKSGATTDRHGNFKISVGPGLRQVTRLFQLLEEIQRLQNVISTTPNIPILQSTIIETAE